LLAGYGLEELPLGPVSTCFACRCPRFAVLYALQGSKFPRAKPELVVVKELADAKTGLFDQEHYEEVHL
jgi:hypothetical protein